MIGFFPIQILVFRMLRNNANIRRCLHFELGLPVMSLVKIHPQRTWCNNIPQIKLKWPPHYYHPKSIRKLVLLHLDGRQRPCQGEFRQVTWPKK